MGEIFAGMPVEQLAEMLGPHTVHRFVKKELVIRPESEGEAIYCVRQGKIRLFLTDPGGKEFTINVLGPGDIFSGHTRCCGEALTDGEVLAIGRKAFADLVIRHPEAYIRLIPVLGRSLKNAFDIIEGLVFKACSSRLAWFLLSEAERRGTATPAGITVDLDLTTEQIATRIGATRQTASTLLNDLARQGIIERRRGTVLVREIERLRRISVEGELA